MTNKFIAECNNCYHVFPRRKMRNTNKGLLCETCACQETVRAIAEHWKLNECLVFRTNKDEVLLPIYESYIKARYDKEGNDGKDNLAGFKKYEFIEKYLPSLRPVFKNADQSEQLNLYLGKTGIPTKEYINALIKAYELGLKSRTQPT